MLKSILKNLNVLNVLLTGAIVVWVYLMAIPSLNPDTRISIPSVTEMVAGTGSPALVNPSPVDFAIISDKNLFNPQRKIPEEKKIETVNPKPDVVLYGILMMDSVQVAFIEDRKTPKTTPGRGKRQLALHIGDHVADYVLQQIEVDRIVLVKGEDRIVVRLDGENRSTAELAGGLPASPAITAPISGAMQPTAPQTSSTNTPSFQALTPSVVAGAPAPGLQQPYLSRRNQLPELRELRKNMKK